MYRLQAGKSLDQGSMNYQQYQIAVWFTNQGKLQHLQKLNVSGMTVKLMMLLNEPMTFCNGSQIFM